MQTFKNPILVFENIAAGESKTIEKEIRRPARMKQIIMRFFPGQENDLIVRPYIRKTSGAVQDLSAYTGNAYFAGDDNDLVFEVDFVLEQYDKFCVEVSNNDITYAYDVYCLGLIEFGGVQHGT